MNKFGHNRNLSTDELEKENSNFVKEKLVLRIKFGQTINSNEKKNKKNQMICSKTRKTSFRFVSIFDVPENKLNRDEKQTENKSKSNPR